MRIFTLFICVLCFSLSCFSQSLYNNIYSPPYTTDLFTVGQYDTAQLSWGISPTIYDICSDLDGNMYICGDAGLNPKFNNSTIWTDYCFIAKFSPEGQLLLSIDLNVAYFGDSGINGLCVDNQNNIYAYFRFDNNLLFNGTLFNPGNGNYAVAKWDQFGNEVWVTQFDVSRIYEIGIDNDGTKVAFTGIISDSLFIDSIFYFANTNYVTNFTWNVYVGTLNASNGTLQWVTASEASESEWCTCVSIDEEGNVYAPIYFNGIALEIDGNMISRTNLNDPLATALCRFTPAGNLDWSLVFNGNINFHHSNLIDNNCFLGGFTYSDTLQVNNVTLINTEGSMGIYCKVSAGSNLEWITPIFAKASHLSVKGLCTNAYGETLVYGKKSGSDTITYSTEIIDSSGSSLFYLKLDKYGQLEWYKGYGVNYNFGYLHGISWGEGKDFYSLIQTSPYGPPVSINNFILNDPEDKIEFIPKMYDYSQQDVVLPQGWAMVSSFINPMEDSLDILLEDVDTNMIILKDPNGLVYWPQYSVNTIGNWDFHDGYQSKMVTTDTVHFVGERQKPNTTEIPLFSGWNMISYLNITENNVDSVFAPYLNQTIIVKDGAGLVYWPQYNLNLMGEMSPGQGYQIKTNQNVSFYYPGE